MKPMKPVITDLLTPGYPIIIMVSPEDEERIKQANVTGRTP